MRGIKHNTVCREVALHFKQYIERCPPREKPQEDRQVVLFIEGLKNEHLKDLHLKKCETLDEVTKEAVYLVDNYQIYGEVNKEVGTTLGEVRMTTTDTQTAKSVTSQVMNTDQLAEEIMRKLSQNLQVQNQRVPSLRHCLTCGGDHPSPTTVCQAEVDKPHY